MSNPWRHTILRALQADAMGAELSAPFWRLLAEQEGLTADDDSVMLFETGVVIAGQIATGDPMQTDRVA